MDRATAKNLIRRSHLLLKPSGGDREENVKEAMVLLNEVLQDFPNHPVALSFLGDAYVYLHELTEAEKWFRKAVSSGPGFCHASIMLFDVLMSNRKFDEAVDEMIRFLSMNDEPRYWPAIQDNIEWLLQEQQSEVCIRLINRLKEETDFGDKTYEILDRLRYKLELPDDEEE